jgi:hypothetical protein
MEHIFIGGKYERNSTRRRLIGIKFHTHTHAHTHTQLWGEEAIVQAEEFDAEDVVACLASAAKAGISLSPPSRTKLVGRLLEMAAPKPVPGRWLLLCMCRVVARLFAAVCAVLVLRYKIDTLQLGVYSLCLKSSLCILESLCKSSSA